MSLFKEKRFRKPRDMDLAARERVLSLVRDALLRRPEIGFAYAHGSFAKGEEFRDLDVGIYLTAPQGFFFEADLTHEVSRLAGVEVDVKAIQSAPLAFQMAVVRDGRLLFSRDEELRTDFIEGVSRRYPEYAHFRNLFLGIESVRRQ